MNGERHTVEFGNKWEDRKCFSLWQTNDVFDCSSAIVVSGYRQGYPCLQGEQRGQHATMVRCQELRMEKPDKFRLWTNIGL